MELWLDAYSFIPQSTVVDMVNIGMTNAFDDKSLDFQLLAQVHDSILIQVPPEWEKAAKDCKKIALDYMMPTIQYGAREFQIPTDVKVGYDWSNMRGVNVTSQTLATDIREAIEAIEEETR